MSVIGLKLPSRMRCYGCGTADLVSVEPGREPKAFGNDLFTYERGAAERGWCLRCWARRWGGPPSLAEAAG